MKRFFLIVLLIAATGICAFAEETSFRSVRLPNPKGKLVKAVLTFSDNHKDVEITPSKGNTVNIAFTDIDKISYEYTEDLGTGLRKIHWLQIDYHAQGLPKVTVVRMRKRDYIRILDAVKAHTGHDAEVLGNVARGLR